MAISIVNQWGYNAGKGSGLTVDILCGGNLIEDRHVLLIDAAYDGTPGFTALYIKDKMNPTKLTESGSHTAAFSIVDLGPNSLLNLRSSDATYGFDTSYYRPFWSSDGLKVYFTAASQLENKITEITVATPFAISSFISENDAYTVPSANIRYLVHISPDGTLLFYRETTTDDLCSIGLSTPWVPSSASGTIKRVTQSSTFGTDIAMDGSCIVININGNVAQRNMSTPWDLNTLGPVIGSPLPSGQYLYELSMSPDGTRLLYRDLYNDVKVYVLNTKYNPADGGYEIYTSPFIYIYSNVEGLHVATRDTWYDKATHTVDLYYSLRGASTSEEYAATAILIKEVELQGIHTVLGQTGTAASCTISAPAITASQLKFISTTVDNSQQPYSYSQCNYLIEDQSTSGGSGSVGAGAAYSSSLIAESMIINFSGSDQYVGHLVVLDTFVVQLNKNITAIAALSLGANVTVAVKDANTAYPKGIATTDFSGSYITSGYCSMVCRAIMNPALHPLEVIGYRFEKDEAEANTTWLSELNAPTDISGGGYLNYQPFVAIHEEYEAYDRRNQLPFKIRFLVKNVSSAVPIALRPFGEMNAVHRDSNLPGWRAVWNTPSSSEGVAGTLSPPNLDKIPLYGSTLFYEDVRPENTWRSIESNDNLDTILIRSKDNTAVYSFPALYNQLMPGYVNTYIYYRVKYVSATNAVTINEIDTGFVSNRPFSEELWRENPTTYWINGDDVYGDPILYKSVDECLTLTTTALTKDIYASIYHNSIYYAFRKDDSSQGTVVETFNPTTQVFTEIYNANTEGDPIAGARVSTVVLKHPLFDVFILFTRIEASRIQGYVYDYNANDVTDEFDVTNAQGSYTSLRNFEFTDEGIVGISTFTYSTSFVTVFEYNIVTKQASLISWNPGDDPGEDNPYSSAYIGNQVIKTRSVSNVSCVDVADLLHMGDNTFFNQGYLTRNIDGASMNLVTPSSNLPALLSTSTRIPVLDETKNTSGGWEVLRYIDTATNELVSLVQASDTTGTSENYTMAIQFYEVRTIAEHKISSTQKIGTGTYQSTNTAVIRRGFSEEPVATLALNEEVEVVIACDSNTHNMLTDPSSAYWDLLLGPLQFRLNDFDGYISLKKSPVAKMYMHDGVGTGQYAEASLTGKSTVTGTAEIPLGSYMFGNATVVAEPITLRGASAKLYGVCTSEFICGSDGIDIVAYQQRFNPPDTGAVFTNVCLDDSNKHQLSIVEFDIDEPYIKHYNYFSRVKESIFGWSYGAVHARWMLHNHANVAKTIQPKIQVSVDGAAFADIDINGGVVQPVWMESYHSDFYNVDTNPFSFYDNNGWYPSNSGILYVIDKDTEFHVFIYDATIANTSYHFFKTIINKASGVITSVEDLNESADDPDGPRQRINTNYHIGRGTNIDLPNGDSLGCDIGTTNNTTRSNVLRYNSSVNKMEIVLITVPAGEVQETEFTFNQVITDTSNNVVMIAASDAVNDLIFLSHYNQTTHTYDTGVEIVLPGFAHDTWRVGTFFARANTDTIKMIVFRLSDKRLFDVNYNSNTKVFDTPIDLGVTATSLGLPWDPTYGWSYTPPGNQEQFFATTTDSNGITTILLMSRTDVANNIPECTVWSYDSTTDSFTYVDGTVGNLYNVTHMQNDGGYVTIGDHQRYSQGFAPYEDDPDYQRIMSYRAVPTQNDTHVDGTNWGRRHFYFWHEASHSFRSLTSRRQTDTDYLEFDIATNALPITEQNQIDQIMSTEPYLTVNKAGMSLRSQIFEPLTLQPNTSVEVQAELAIGDSWVWSIVSSAVNGKEGNIRIALVDDTELLDDRSNILTINCYSTKTAYAAADLNGTATVEAVGTRETGSDTNECDIQCIALVEAVATSTGVNEGKADLNCIATTDFEGRKISHGLFVHGLNGNADFNVEGYAIFGGSIDALGNAVVIGSAHSNKYSAADLVCSAEMLSEPSKKLIASSSLSCDAIFDASPNANKFANTFMKGVGYFDLSARKDVFAFSSLLCFADLTANGKSDKSNFASLGCISTLSPRPKRIRASALNLLSKGFLSSVPSKDLRAAGFLNCEAKTLFTARSALSATVSMFGGAIVNGSLSWNDNRDIILFSSNIERVVEFTLYDNDTNFVQDITTNYPVTWDMSKLNMFDLPINQLQSFDSYIDQVREFELQSVELEPILFTGDITMKIEYDLNIVQEVIYETEISTDIEYNMQIEKVSDKVIPIGL